MKAEEMVRVIKNQLFLFGNPLGVNILISHLHSVVPPRGILSFVDLQATAGPLPNFWEPFSFKLLRSHVSHNVTRPSLEELLTSVKCRSWKKSFAVQKIVVHCCPSSLQVFSLQSAQGPVRKRLLCGRESTSHSPGRQEGCD